jgi:hypothetical protein
VDIPASLIVLKELGHWTGNSNVPLTEGDTLIQAVLDLFKVRLCIHARSQATTL